MIFGTYWCNRTLLGIYTLCTSTTGLFLAAVGCVQPFLDHVHLCLIASTPSVDELQTDVGGMCSTVHQLVTAQSLGVVCYRKGYVCFGFKGH